MASSLWPQEEDFTTPMFAVFFRRKLGGQRYPDRYVTYRRTAGDKNQLLDIVEAASKEKIVPKINLLLYRPKSNPPDEAIPENEEFTFTGWAKVTKVKQDHDTKEWLFTLDFHPFPTPLRLKDNEDLCRKIDWLRNGVDSWRVDSIFRVYPNHFRLIIKKVQELAETAQQ